VVLPRIGAGLHRHDAIPTLVVREHLALAEKVRVERRVVVVDRMRVFPRRVGLPHLDERPPHGPSVLVEKPADEHHLLAERRAPQVVRSASLSLTKCFGNTGPAASSGLGATRTSGCAGARSRVLL